MKLKLCMLVLCLFAAQGGRSETIAEIHVPDDLTKAELTAIKQLGLSFDRCGGARSLYVTPAQKQALQSGGVRFSVEHDDIEQFYRSRNTGALDFGGFRTFSQIEAYLDSLATAHPSLMTAKYSVGTTIQGRSLWVVKISDNPTLDEAEPELFYNSLIHAREPASASSLLHFMEYVLTNYGIDQTVTDIVNGRELYFMPVVNPDGYAYNEQLDEFGGGLWRKNRRLISGTTYGVDLNRNFAYGWGEDDEGSSGAINSDVYRGSTPFSEPETAALRDFVRSREFVFANNVHCYSNLYLWPWGGSARIKTPFEALFSAIGDSLASQNGYDPGIGWDLYPVNGAADDWMWGDTTGGRKRTISFTTEIGSQSDGFWPDPARIPQLVQENVQPNLFLAKIADQPFKFAAPIAPTLQAADSVAPDFQLTWQHGDSINPAITYKLYELKNQQSVIDNVELVTATNWTTQRFARTTVRAHSGLSSWTTQDANGEGHWLQSAQPRVVAPNDSLVFWVWYSIETNYDYFYAQISSDGGYEFSNLAGNLTTNADPLNFNLGNGMNGSSGGWQRAAFSLAGYEGREVLFRLTLITDGGTLGEGVYIDDIEDVTLYASETLVSGAVADTTYDFTGKPVGDYWYRVQATDAEGQVGQSSATAKRSVRMAFLLGDLDGSGQIDIADLTFLVAYLFQDGPAPDPLGRGNTDCIGSIDIADLTRMVDYLFISGELLTCP